ncbi:MAG: hypothetical protein AB1344_07430 [Pseudomonadota bacterium]
MNIKLTLLSATIAAACFGLPAHAYQPGETSGERTLGRGIQEIPDPTLSDMRGRYVAGDNSILYFGVQMMSEWDAGNGQMLKGGVNLGMDFRSGGSTPKVSFKPTVSIYTPHGGASPVDTTGRSIDSKGLYNPRGMVQGIQLAGDWNSAHNRTAVLVTDEMPAGGPYDGQQTLAQMSADGATATAAIAGDEMLVKLDIANQGVVEQFVRGGGGLSQLIAAKTDNNVLYNQLQLTLVKDMSVQSANMGQNMAHSLEMMRGICLP